MSQRTGNVLIVIAIIILNILLWTGHHGGRTIDYTETQQEQWTE